MQRLVLDYRAIRKETGQSKRELKKTLKIYGWELLGVVRNPLNGDVSAQIYDPSMNCRGRLILKIGTKKAHN